MDIKDMQENAAKASQMLKAISHESRLLILCLLVNNEMSAGELAGYSDLSQSAFSQHLSVLREKDLVKIRKESQTVYYSIKDENIKKVLATLHSIYCE